MALTYSFPASPMSAGNIIVHTTGTGSDVESARIDAIRQALQQVVRQLIVVDRVIENSDLVRDKIMSTMSGYIDNFSILQIRKDSNGMLVLDAEISVSSSRIVNFIGTGAGVSTAISGGMLNADSERELAQRQALGEIFTHLLRGFPAEALRVNFTNVDHDIANPDNIDFTYTIDMSKPWLDSLRSGLAALSVAKLSRNGSGKGNLGINLGYAKSMDPEFNNLLINGSAGRTFGAKFCIYEPEMAECYLLPPGDYGKGTLIPPQEQLGLGWATPSPLLALRFLTKDGETIPSAGKHCLLLDLYHRPNSINQEYKVKLASGRGGNARIYTLSSHGPIDYYLGQTFDLYAESANGRFVVDRNGVDFSTVTSVVALPFYGAFIDPRGARIMGGLSNIRNWAAITDITGPASAEDKLCNDEMDTAARNAAFHN